jgi:uncharacterized protein
MLAMIRRTLEKRLHELADKFPVVTVTGPRQSGKTTLCRTAFPDRAYASLEAPDVQDYARDDPRGFLSDFSEGAVLDEIQRVPELLSYIQTLVDAHPRKHRFILTGSVNFALLESVGQSLAGRTALLNLLPLSLEEIRRFPSTPDDLNALLVRGSYPAVYDRELEPGDWYPSYVAAYLERDVRMLLNVGDLVSFQTFLRLCAGRAGQLVNLSALGADAGVTHVTAGSWLSVLEAGFVAWRLPPFHRNLGKRLVKTPKLHFLDSGLVCYLLGIRSPAQLRDHPLRGTIFETWVAAEILKARAHRGLQPALSFYRDSKGTEVDLLVELGNQVLAVETKSGQTVTEDAFGGLTAFRTAIGRADLQAQSFVIHGGDQSQKRTAATAIPWSRIDETAWWSEDEWQDKSV